MADTDPCSLLTADGSAQLGVGRGEPDKVGSARGCKWEARDPSGDLLILGVDVRDNAGLDDLPSNKEIKKLPSVGRHEAVQTSQGSGAGTCTVALGITDSARVDAVVAAGRNQQKACELALKLATLIEPELP